MGRPHLRCSQRFLDGIDDRLDLTLILSGTQHEEIGESRCVTEIEHDDIKRFLVEGRTDHLPDLAR